MKKQLINFILAEVIATVLAVFIVLLVCKFIPGFRKIDAIQLLTFPFLVGVLVIFVKLITGYYFLLLAYFSRSKNQYSVFNVKNIIFVITVSIFVIIFWVLAEGVYNHLLFSENNFEIRVKKFKREVLMRLEFLFFLSFSPLVYAGILASVLSVWVSSVLKK